MTLWATGLRALYEVTDNMNEFNVLVAAEEAELVETANAEMLSSIEDDQHPAKVDKRPFVNMTGIAATGEFCQVLRFLIRGERL